MKSITILTIAAVLFFFCCLPVDSKGTETLRGNSLGVDIVIVNIDTIPATAKPVEEAGKTIPAVKPVTDVKPTLPEKPLSGKPVKTVIKQVPKARKVEVPVKVKIVRPKIIKPAVKIL